MDLSYVTVDRISRTISGLHVIPYLVLIGVAIFLQYYQMKQMNSRNPQAAAGQSADAANAEILPHYFRCHLPKSARWSNHLHGGFIGHENRNSGHHVPHGDGDAGGSDRRARDRGRRQPAKGDTARRQSGRASQAGHRNGRRRSRAAPSRQPARPKRRAKSANAAKRTTAANGKAQTAGKTGTNGKAPTNGKRPTNGKSPATARASNGTNSKIERRGNRAGGGAERAPTLAIQEDKKGSIERGVGRSSRKDHRRGNRAGARSAGCGGR